MFVVGVALAALAWSPAQLDLSAGLRLENRSGVSPRVPGSDPELAIDFIINPSLSTLYRSSEVTVRANYGPRVFMRGGGGAEQFRPLLLHSADAAIDWEVTRRLRLGLTARGSIGAINYSYTFTPGDENSPVVPTEDTLEFMTGDVGVQSSFRWSPIVTQATGVSVAYSAPVGAGGAGLPEQLRTRGGITFAIAPSVRDALELGLSGELVEFPGTIPSPDPTMQSRAPRLGFMNPRVGLVHRFDSRYVCTLRVGALALFSPEIVNPTNPSDVRGGFSMLPSFDATCTADAYRGPDLRVGANLQLGVVGFANPLLQRVDPRAVVGAGITMVLPPRTSIAVTASFFTPATLDTVEASGLPGGALLTETLLDVRAPVRFQLADEYSLEVGGRFLARGPRLAAPEFSLGNFDAQAYVAFNLALTTQSQRVRPTVR